MPEPVSSKEIIKENSAAPYRELYIYLLNGLLREDEEGRLGDDFMGNWIEEGSSFLFFKRPVDSLITDLAKDRPGLDLIDNYHFSYEQWQGGSPERVKIDDIVIIPAWEKMKDNEKGIRILLDPGVVFGNGLHPTTGDCLRAVSFAAENKDLDKVLDLGTGTGLLALAAAHIGAKRVLAIDLNPLCVKTAINNVDINDLDNIVRVSEGPAEEFINEPADLVVANVHYSVIKMILKRRVFSNRDRIILSGLMRSQYRDVKAKLQRSGFKIIREWDHEMIWFTVLAERNYYV